MDSAPPDLDHDDDDEEEHDDGERERSVSARSSGTSSDARPSWSLGRGMRGAALALLVLIGGCLGGAIVRGIWAILTPAPEAPAEVIEVRSTPDVITAVRDLARLETTSFHVERVIELTSTQRRLFGLVHAEDSILLVAASDVVAGVDLSEMRDGDVTVDHELRRATVVLPPARIFSARLDNDRTFVYHRRTDALAQRRESLETRARQEAERTLGQAAIEGGILTRAEDNARRTIEGLVRALGFREVEVRFRAELD